MEMISRIEGLLEAALNPSVLTGDSVYGVVVLILILAALVFAVRRFGGAVMVVFGVILLMEIGHAAVYYSGLGLDYAVLRTIFRYDVFTALAQLCVGTKLCEILCYAQAFIVVAAEAVGSGILWIISIVRGFTAALF